MEGNSVTSDPAPTMGSLDDYVQALTTLSSKGLIDLPGDTKSSSQRMVARYLREKYTDHDFYDQETQIWLTSIAATVLHMHATEVESGSDSFISANYPSLYAESILGGTIPLLNEQSESLAAAVDRLWEIQPNPAPKFPTVDTEYPPDTDYDANHDALAKDKAHLTILGRRMYLTGLRSKFPLAVDYYYIRKHEMQRGGVAYSYFRQQRGKTTECAS